MRAGRLSLPRRRTIGAHRPRPTKETTSAARPATLTADCGYDHGKYRRLVWKRGVKPMIARRQKEHGSGLGRHCWVVERTFAWLDNRRRLLVRTDRCDDIHEGFLALACCLICGRRFGASFD
jgi:transposase